VLFEGTGNVVQESANLFWDNTNGRLGIGTSSPLSPLDVVTSAITIYPRLRTTSTASNTDVGLRFQDGTTGTSNSDGLYLGRSVSINYLWTYEAEPLVFGTNNAERMRLFSTGNIGINTTTDAGFKLDVNGTARVQDNLTISKNQNLSTRITLSNTTSGNLSQSIYEATSSNGTAQFGKTSASFSTFKILTANDTYFYNGTSGDISLLNDFATGRIKFAAGASSTAQMTLFSTGNVAINTTTDAGFKLDVNGTARVKDAGSELAITSPLASNAPVIFTTKGASGGYRGGYNFKGGFGGTAGNTILIIDTTNTDAGSRVGIGNFVFGDLSSAKVTIDNTQSGGRNAGLKLRANFADIITQYNGIQFDTIELGNGGAFVGSQRNTAASGYGSDLVVLNTAESPSNTYVETARFIGRYNSFYVGTDKTLAVASAKMQVESTTQGFLPPRMTTTQKNAIASPATGLMVYDTTLNVITYYNGTTWI
jgi:hypothetical protein